MPRKPSRRKPRGSSPRVSAVAVRVAELERKVAELSNEVSALRFERQRFGPYNPAPVSWPFDNPPKPVTEPVNPWYPTYPGQPPIVTCSAGTPETPVVTAGTPPAE